MVRNYVPNKDGRGCRKYSDKSLQNALEAVDTGLSITAASKQFKIPKGTLLNRIHGKHQKKHGRPTVLTEEEEKILKNKILLCADWGFPLDTMDIRMVVKSYLDNTGRDVSMFRHNLPGCDWVDNFLKRHKADLSSRRANYIKRKRAEVDAETLKLYHENVCKVLKDVKPEAIFNYDESNLSDTPSSKKYIFRRGVKYCDSVLNHTKSCVSLMFCTSADGTLLPPYVVYKSDNMYESWAKYGPKRKPCCEKRCCKEGTQFTNTHSGWFDGAAFEKWFEQSFLPHAKLIDGPKILIGDNLSSHFSIRVIELSELYNIRFVCLPPNATHLAQPLDVSFFAPLKRAWSQILLDFKRANPHLNAVNKNIFPSLLNDLLAKSVLTENIRANIISGFRGTGLYPQELQPLLKRLNPALDEVPDVNLLPVAAAVLDTSLSELLKQQRFKGKCGINATQRGKKIVVTPGVPITTSSFRTTDIGASTSGLKTKPKHALKTKYHNAAATKRIKKREVTSCITDSDSETDSGVSDKSDMNVINAKKPKKVAKKFDPQINHFVLVKVPTEKGNNKLHLALIKQITGTGNTDTEYSINYLDVVPGSNRKKFVLNELDKDKIDKDDFVELTLPDPNLNSRGQYIFSKPVEVSEYKVY